MVPEYNRKSLLIGIPGLLIQIGSVFLPLILGALGVDTARLPQWVASGLLLGFILGPLLGAVLLIIGLCYYAKGKGYSAALGLLGLLSCIGLLILAVLPDKTKD
jgi:MFS family permease